MRDAAGITASVTAPGSRLKRLPSVHSRRISAIQAHAGATPHMATLDQDTTGDSQWTPNPATPKTAANAPKRVTHARR